MKVEAQMINELGKSIPTRQRESQPQYRGRLRIREARSDAIGRIVTTADLISLTDGADSSVVPTLHDVNAIYLESGKMRIGGFEIVGGAQYGQVWDPKVSQCSRCPYDGGGYENDGCRGYVGHEGGFDGVVFSMASFFR